MTFFQKTLTVMFMLNVVGIYAAFIDIGYSFNETICTAALAWQLCYYFRSLKQTP